MSPTDFTGRYNALIPVSGYLIRRQNVARMFQAFRGIKALRISTTSRGHVKDETLQICTDRAIPSLAIFGGNHLSEEAILNFCFPTYSDNAHADDAEGRLFCVTEARVSEHFFHRIVQVGKLVLRCSMDPEICISQIGDLSVLIRSDPARCRV